MNTHYGKPGGYSLNPKAREFKIPQILASPGGIRDMKDHSFPSDRHVPRDEGWSLGREKIQQPESARSDMPHEFDRIKPHTSHVLSGYFDTIVPCSKPSTLEQGSDPTSPPSRVLPSIDHFMVPIYPDPATQPFPYETYVRPEASPTSSGLLKPRRSDLPNSRNAPDLASLTGEASDWHCKSCGTFYTEDVPNCFVCHKLEQHSASYRSQENRTTIEVVPFQHVSPQHPLLGVEHPSRAPLQPLGKGFETYPSPTLTLERLLKHVDALLRLGHSDIDLKEVLVEGDISLCMDLGMKGLIGKEALNPWKSLSINIPDQPFLKQMPKPPLGSVAGDWTCSCGRENWAKRSVCSRCFPGIEPEYKAIVYNRVRPVFELVTAQMRETHLRQDAERLSSEERRLRRRDLKP